MALRGALDLIAKAGGGYPQDTQGKKISASFLYNTTRSLYEQTGFSYDRPKGKNHCVMRRTVSPAMKPRRARVGGHSRALAQRSMILLAHARQGGTDAPPELSPRRALGRG